MNMAKAKLPKVDIRIGVFEDLPYTDNYFDIVLSKYAIQTSPNLELVFKEIHRVLKSGGILMYLVTHPFRQFFEKKDGHADYFEQKIVESCILNNAVIVKEPTHSLDEYFSQTFSMGLM